MPCVPLPIPPLPTLPAPLSASPPQPPPLPAEPNVCCKLPPIPQPKDIPPIPPQIMAAAKAVLATLDAGIDAILAYKNKIPLKCPKE